MDEKLSIFAVSPTAFDEFASQIALGDLLQLYVDSTPPDTQRLLPLYIYEADNLRIRYVARPSGGLFYFNGGRVKLLPKSMMRQVPFLAMPLKAYLSERGSVELLSVLECLSFVNAFDWLTCVVNRERRWWIGSYLEAIEPFLTGQENTFEYTCWLFQKVLRGMSCGKSLPPATFRHLDFEFPVHPADDRGTEMGVWGVEEVQFMLQLLEYTAGLATQGMISFHAPPEPIGLSPVDTDDQWNEWVGGQVEALRQIAVTVAAYPDTNMISFIDS